MSLKFWIILNFLVLETQTCILLLNGWQPLAVSERALLADIVIVAKCLQTNRNTERTSETYSALFRVENVLKGDGYIQDLKLIHGDKEAFNVTNFGDKQMCYSDVAVGESYVLFLTVFEHRLSAKYDDLFGATAEKNEDNIEEIFNALGWQSWTSWDACTTSCGGGTQKRRRECVPKDSSACDVTHEESRKCNTFKCKGVKDLVDIFQLSSLPTGVSRSRDRTSAFVIDITSSIHSPTSKIFHRNFPQEFSVVITAKPQLNNNGYLLTISDLLGFIKLGIQVGTNPGFIYSDAMGGTDKDDVVRFPVDLSDGNWHQISFSVRKSNVTLILDCDIIITRSLRPIRDFQIGPSTVTSLGKTFIESSYSTRYVVGKTKKVVHVRLCFVSINKGEIEQLIIINDPTAAWRQCSEKHPQMQSDNALIENPHNEVSISEEVETDTENYGVFTWSEWSECSATCGRGVRARVAYCSAPMTSQCKNDVIGGTQTKKCHREKCPGRCKVTCLNGSTCKKSKCICPVGYYGRQCEIVSCNPGCYNGGSCVEPDQCSCPPGYNGQQCQEAKCDPECGNGGRCVLPGVCSCPYGFMPPDCKPICSLQCLNGGTCTGYNHCRCAPGYTGAVCQTAMCSTGCGPGGRCVAPETCLCPSGYIGAACETPVCQPSCLNGGSCVLPFFCACPSGTYGSACEHFFCRPHCLNGGTCIGLNICECPVSHHGDFCEKEHCPDECLNGGTCDGHGMCRCPTGYTGPSCRERDCDLRAYREPIQKRFRKPVTTREPYACGFLGWKTCHRTRRRYKPAFKTYFRVVYRCDETTE